MPNQKCTPYSYDIGDRLTNITHTSTVSGTIESVAYGMDRVGNRTVMTDTAGTTSYLYDNLYRLTRVNYPDGTTVSYQYDAVGNRTVMTDTAGTISYAYDAADRLQSVGADTYTWDANGNNTTRVTAGGTMTYTYDLLGRLTQVVTGTESYQYAYDGDGTRVRKTVNGSSTDYVWDKLLENPVVLTDTGSIYQYGLGVVARQAGADKVYYHADGLGSIRNLTNAAGQVVNGYGYDTFGASRSGTGTGANDFRFAGEQLDPETGMYYLRARYYNPAIGRFTSPDPIMPGPRNPRALNLYNYSYNNPANLIDPSGKYVLIIGGVETSYDREIAPDGAWAALKTELGVAFPRDGMEEIGHFDWTAGGRHQSSFNPFAISTQRPVGEAAKDLANLLYWIARNKLKNPNETIKIIGHSKGGALAMEYLAQIANGTAKQDELVFERLSHVFTLDSPLDGNPISMGARFSRYGTINGGLMEDRFAFLPERLMLRGLNVRIANFENPNDWVGNGPLPTRSSNYRYESVPRGDYVEGHIGLLGFPSPGFIKVHGNLQTDPWVIGQIIGEVKTSWLRKKYGL